MDLSKLPKMSESPPPPVSRDPMDERVTRPVQILPAAGAEAWISIAIGAILLLAHPFFAQWLVSLVTAYKPGFLPITDTTTGQEIPYPQSIFFFSHLCVFAFAIVLIMDGLILFTRHPLLVGLALALTVITTLLNGVYLLRSMSNGEGFPIISAMAVAFGIYIAMYQWKLLSAMRRTA